LCPPLTNSLTKIIVPKGGGGGVVVSVSLLWKEEIKRRTQRRRARALGECRSESIRRLQKNTIRKSEKRARTNNISNLKIRAKSHIPCLLQKVFVYKFYLGRKKRQTRTTQKCVLYDERSFIHDRPLSPFTGGKTSKKGLKTRRDLVAFTFGPRWRDTLWREGEFRPRS
jgi:hypothetical protein